jgi:VCBS repeat-containing protein
MNVRVSATGLMQRLLFLSGALILSFLAVQQVAHAAPVVSVDHRVTATYSGIRYDAGKGQYSIQVRIRNRSGAVLYSPLRLAFEQSALKEIRLLKEHGTGKDGLPYFEFSLPKGLLAAGKESGPVKISFAVEKYKDRYDGDKKDEKEKGKKKGKDAARKGRVDDLISALRKVQRASAGIETAPLEPRAEPYALKAGSGKVNVRFSVPLAGKADASATVYLRSVGSRKGIAMNDKGKNGDLIAKDGIHGVSIQVDTSKLKPDTCLSYEAYIKAGRAQVVSAPLRICVSAFPVRVADSKGARTVDLAEGTKAVADEVLIVAVPGIKSDSIRRLAAGINASVVGSIPPQSLYQLKLQSPVIGSRLLELVAQLNARTEVRAASINAVGNFAYTPSDPEFASQHGLQRVRAHDVWDVGATGSGTTVTVLDSGLDRTHPDFGAPGNCQLAENDCGGPNTDGLGHGTQVAGVVGARTGNALGVAGAAHGGKIHAILVSADAAVTAAEMTQGFTDAAAYGVASVINASFSALNAFADWTPVCNAINSAVLNAGVPVAVVANAAGNSNANGNYYPARCNDLNAALTRKDLFITVANSASAVDAACGSVAVDQRCSTSNYGAWVDIAAPGSAIRTTTLAGAYASPTGTSFSAPMVAGAAAILRSCGVALDQIEPTLRTSANVTVPFPGGSSAPRLDIFRAMSQLNHVPSGVGLSGGSVGENTDTSGGYEVGTLTTTDADTCDKYTYSIVPGGDSALFGIGGVNGDRLRLTAGVLNYEVKASYAVTVRVTDFFGSTFDQPVTVNVVNVNEAPIIANQIFSVSENSANGAGVGTVVSSDPDAGDTKSFSITAGNTGGAFGINISTGVISVANGAALNFEAATAFNLTVRVADGGGLSSTATVTVNINNVNEAPFIANQTFSVSENSANGTMVGTVVASDPDAGDTKSFSITAGNAGGAFNINTSTGVISVANGAALDFEAAAAFSLTVEVADGGGLSSTATVTVNINNVNEAPFIADQSFPVNENSINGTPIGTVAAGDPDAGSTLSYSITGANPGGFVIDPVTGALSVGNSAAMNHEASPSFSFMVQVSDGALSASATVTVNVANVNEAPFIADQSFPVNENSINGTLIGTVATGDPDAGSTLTYSITGANPGGFVIDPATGALSIGNSVAMNHEASPSFSFMVQVSDGALSSTATVTVNVANVNEAPLIADQSFPVNENSINGTLIGTVAAGDLDAGSTLTYSITGANPGGFVIDPATGALSIGNSVAMNHEASPSFSFMVQVSDGALSASATVTVNVANVNEAPVIANQTLPALDENSTNGTAVGTVVSSDPDAGDSLSYSITAGNTGNAFAIGAATGAITVNHSAALDFETTPVFNLTVRVTDGGGLFAAATVTVNLNNLSETIPNPILVFDHKEVGTNYLGDPVDRYRFTVSNWNAYPAAMFVARPDLPACGLNTSASRTWVDFYRTSDNSRIYGFCALGTPANLNLIWFGMLPAGTPPPASVYITLTDRETGIVYTSNSVAVPFP